MVCNRIFLYISRTFYYNWTYFYERGILSTVGKISNLLVELWSWLSYGATIREFIAKKTPTYNATRTNAEVALGDLLSEEQRDVLMEIQLPVCSDLTADGMLNNALVALS